MAVGKRIAVASNRVLVVVGHSSTAAAEHGAGIFGALFGSAGSTRPSQPLLGSGWWPSGQTVTFAVDTPFRLVFANGTGPKASALPSVSGHSHRAWEPGAGAQAEWERSPQYTQ